MKSSDSLQQQQPSLNQSASMRSMMERQRRLSLLQRQMREQEPPIASIPETARSANTSNLVQRPLPRLPVEMMIMRPIVLSRRRQPGIGGVDRKRLTSLLNEALAISMDVTTDFPNSASGGEENHATVKDNNTTTK